MTACASRAVAVALAGVLAAPLLTATGCDRRPTTVIEREDGSSSEETSGNLTPLQRGEIRREALADVRAGIAAWTAGDAEGMADYWADDQVERFEKTWAGYAADDLRVKHVHDVDYLDVIEMNSSGTQALVNYRYADASYLVDGSGAKKRSLAEIDVEMQLTVEREGERWRIVRTIAAENAYR